MITLYCLDMIQLLNEAVVAFSFEAQYTYAAALSVNDIAGYNDLAHPLKL